MLKVEIISAREKPNHGIIIHAKVVEGQPAARMRLALPVADQIWHLEISGYGSPYFGPADLVFTIAETDESIQMAVLDSIRQGDFLYLELMSPSLPGEPRAPSRDLD